MEELVLSIKIPTNYIKVDFNILSVIKRIVIC